MSRTLTKEAFDNLLDLVDEAVQVAESAVTIARQPRPHTPTPQVTLTKVASETYRKVANAITKTRVFPGQSAEELADLLKQAGEIGQLEFLEKLASRAMFPLEVDLDLRGDLVEKSALNQATYDNLPATTAAWQKAMDEAEQELNH